MSIIADINKMHKLITGISQGTTVASHEIKQALSTVALNIIRTLESNKTIRIDHATGEKKIGILGAALDCSMHDKYTHSISSKIGHFLGHRTTESLVHRAVGLLVEVPEDRPKRGGFCVHQGEKYFNLSGRAAAKTI
ncbi:MAG: hypothetical protein NTX49_07470 [Chlamydiae bacterium]|nr:hypothetical protein [Chlamydiota bacterium]